MNASDEYTSKYTCIIGQGSRNWQLEDSGNNCNGYAISPAEGVLYNALTFLSNLMGHLSTCTRRAFALCQNMACKDRSELFMLRN